MWPRALTAASRKEAAHQRDVLCAAWSLLTSIYLAQAPETLSALPGVGKALRLSLAPQQWLFGDAAEVWLRAENEGLQSPCEAKGLQPQESFWGGRRFSSRLGVLRAACLCQAARHSLFYPRGDFVVCLVPREGLRPAAGWFVALSRGRKSGWGQECGVPGAGEGDGLRWGLCWLPVMVIRCVLEPPGEIRSFPGSRCKRRTPCGLPPDPGRGRAQRGMGICLAA